MLLGDAGGRRYTDTVLDMAIREALGVYRRYYPNKADVKQRVFEVRGPEVLLRWFPDPGTEILSVRNDAGKFLAYAEYRTGDMLYLNMYAEQDLPAAGDMLTLQLNLPHSIKGLDHQTVTTVPDGHALALTNGAAGYAMRIRARSVTEVFGKRPEDREALMNQAEQMITDFFVRLAEIESAPYDPMPRGGFPI